MRSKLGWILAQTAQSLWFRVLWYAIAAIVTALIAFLVSPWVPSSFSERILEGGARQILSILASSMLLMATFSLGTMVAAYAAAASTATPRATKVLIADPTSQNVVASFLGAFVFSIVGLIALNLGFYSPEGEAVLIVAAAAIIFLVIAKLFSWLDHLANLVRLEATINKVAARAETVLRNRAASPRLGGAPLNALVGVARPVLASDVGYVQHIDVPALQKVAAAAEGKIAVERLPGQLVDPSRPLAKVNWPADAGEIERIRKAFTLGSERSFNQDPRYCLVVISEIASRALSPGINDPGTAIGVIGVQHRLLAIWGTECREDAATDYPDVMVPEIAAADLFEDAFGALLRDAAGILEVGIRLQKTLAALAEIGPGEFSAIARGLSERAVAHADHVLAVDHDRKLLANAAESVGSRTL